VRDRLHSAAPLLIPALIVVAIVGLVGLADSEVLTRMTTRFLISLIIVVGLYIFIGNSGVVSFGHIGFMAIGAYVGALLTIPVVRREFLLPDLPGWLATIEVSLPIATLAAMLVAATFAFFVGIPILRLQGIGASIATFALLAIVRVVVSNWESVTRGTGSMPGVPTDATPANTLVVALVALAIAFAYQSSRSGRRLRATREDHYAADGAGINIVAERTIAFVLSAAVVASGGVMFGHFVGVFSPDDFYLTATLTTLAMLVVGGIHSLAGAVVGTIVVTVVTEGLIRIESGVDVAGFSVSAPAGLQETGLAAFLLIILIVRPSGIMGARELGLRRRRRPGAPEPPELVPPAPDRPLAAPRD
jgi:branched-chain amino acid transport system permease protein